MGLKNRQFMFGMPYNILLITVGSLIFGIGVKGIALPHGFISGGISGLSLLLYYWTGRLSPGIFYFLLNAPIFVLGWRYVSRRFFCYSLYGMVVLTLAIEIIEIRIAVQEPMLAALAGGCLIGTGAGLILHSLGSSGGNDVIAVILNQRFNVRMGTFFFVFNIGLLALSLGHLPVDLVLFSLAMSFVTSQVIDYLLNVSNQRKMALIVSDQSNRIAPEILSRLGRGATLLEGRGAYTGRKKEVLLTVINNFQLKRLEELVFSIDDQAFVIMENTLNVLGKGFSQRKTY
ncbi:MAG: YitT family protein [Desulfobacteraceae bacterium]